MRLFTFLFALLFSTVSYAQENQVEAKKKTSRWSGSAEVGVIITGGNSKNLTMSVKGDVAYKWHGNTLAETASYLRTTSNNVESAEKWNWGLKYTRDLSSVTGLLVGQGFEGDVFSGFRYRSNTDVGATFKILDGDRTKISNESGYRYSFERKLDGVFPNNQKIHVLRFYFLGTHDLNESVSAKLWIEFLPDLKVTDNIAFNFEPSLAVTLSSIFSLKVAFTGKFDNVPALAGNEKFDFTYTTALVAKY